MGPTSNSNQYFGVKVSQVGTPVNQASDTQLVYKSNFSTNLFNGPKGVWKVMEGTRAPTIGNGLTAPQHGFWVAQDGIDVQQATDGQMLFNSSNTIVTGTYTVVIGTDQYYTFSIAHNLGFEPSIQSGSFYSPVDGLTHPVPFVMPGDNGTGFAGMSATLSVSSVDATNINLVLGIMDAVGLSFFLTNTVLNFKFLCSTLAAPAVI